MVLSCLDTDSFGESCRFLPIKNSSAAFSALQQFIMYCSELYLRKVRNFIARGFKELETSQYGNICLSLIDCQPPFALLLFC